MEPRAARAVEMTRRMAILTTCGCLAGGTPRAWARQDAGRAAAALRQNVEYAVVRGKTLRLDAHLPAGKRPAPAIVLLHGGGFTGGAKGGYTGELARHLADHGYAAFDIDYRLMGDLGPGATLPQAMEAAREDLARAVEHVVAKSEDYEIDPERIAVGGGSAGAITALIATYGRDRSPRRPRAVVSLWGGMYGQESALRRGDPPALLVHGTADKTVPFAQAESITAAGRKAGVDVVLLGVPNGGHTLPLAQRYQGRTILDSVTAFLDERLR